MKKVALMKSKLDLHMNVVENQIGEAATEVAGHSEGERRERASLIYVRGGRWSPGVRLLGRPLEVEWERAFIW